MGIQGPTNPGYLRTLAVAIVVGALLVSAFRVLIDIVKMLARKLIRRWHLHDEVALFIGTAIVVAVLVLLFDGVLVRGFFAGANAIFQPQDSSTPDGVTQPQLPEKSGSPKSLAPWSTLGFQGRDFVGTGPHAAELAKINGTPAKEPIRIYVGLHTAPDDQGRLDVLVDELERTGAFSRKVLVIAPTTGTGWVDPVAASSVETMYNGDTAIVGLQYSFLPSWISFLADRQKSMDAGRALIHAVHDRWAQLPAQHRPKLVLYGESLGSMAGQAAFGWLPDIRRMGFDAVLWVGPPQESTLWHALIARRDPGSTEVQPRYDNGRTVRFSEGERSRRRHPRHRPAVGRHAGAVPAAPIRPGGVVVARLAVQPARLARRTPRTRPKPCDALEPDSYLLAGQRRPDERRRRAGRARPQLQQRHPRRLGRGGAAGRLGSGRHRTRSRRAQGLSQKR